MKKRSIYLIEPTEAGKKSLYYDCYYGHVVIANNAREARSLCPVGDVNTNIWIDSDLSAVKKIGMTTMKKQVVLSEYRAG